jgi:hypothetical protein
MGRSSRPKTWKTVLARKPSAENWLEFCQLIDEMPDDAFVSSLEPMQAALRSWPEWHRRAVSENFTYTGSNDWLRYESRSSRGCPPDTWLFPLESAQANPRFALLSEIEAFHLARFYEDDEPFFSTEMLLRIAIGLSKHFDSGFNPPEQRGQTTVDESYQVKRERWSFGDENQCIQVCETENEHAVDSSWETELTPYNVAGPVRLWLQKVHRSDYRYSFRFIGPPSPTIAVATAFCRLFRSKRSPDVKDVASVEQILALPQRLARVE